MLQISCAFQQRVRKRQPEGRIGRARHVAGEDDPPLAALRRVVDRHGRQERLRVGMRRPLVDLLTCPDLDDLAQVHDGDPVGTCLTTDRSRHEEVGEAEVALQ